MVVHSELTDFSVFSWSFAPACVVLAAKHMSYKFPLKEKKRKEEKQRKNYGEALAEARISEDVNFKTQSVKR